MEIYEFTLAERDQHLTQIEELIKTKRDILLKKRKKLQETSKQNVFLEGVKKDYQKYHDYILKQKREQYQSMELLKNYIDDLMVSGELTEKDIENTRMEQEEILNEMNHIKKDLEELIQN
jgi:hypothetical protein